MGQEESRAGTTNSGFNSVSESLYARREGDRTQAQPRNARLVAYYNICRLLRVYLIPESCASWFMGRPRIFRRKYLFRWFRGRRRRQWQKLIRRRRIWGQFIQLCLRLCFLRLRLRLCRWGRRRSRMFEKNNSFMSPLQRQESLSSAAADFVIRETFVVCHSLERGNPGFKEKALDSRRSLPRAFPPHADPPVAETRGGNDRPEK